MSRFGIGSLRRLGRRGTTTLELAFVANVFVLLMIGSIEIGRYFFVAESVKYVIGEVARAATINPVSTTGAAAWSSVIAKAPILRAADFDTLVVTVTTADAPALSTIEVTATYRHSFILQPLSGLANTINNFVRIPLVLPSTT